MESPRLQPTLPGKRSVQRGYEFFLGARLCSKLDEEYQGKSQLYDSELLRG